MHHQSSKWIFLLSVLTGNALLFGGTATTVFKKSLVMQPNKTVVVQNRNGNIDIRATQSDSVNVRAEIEVKAGSHREAEEILDQVKIHIDEEAGDVLIDADVPRHSGDGDFWDWIFGRRVDVQVRFFLDVPGAASLNAKTTNGNVTVEKVRGMIKAHSTNGNVHIDKGAGSVDASTTNGNVSADMLAVKADGTISLHTTNGSIHLILPMDAKGNIEASTVNGSLSTDFPMNVQGRITGKRVYGTLNGGGGLIELKTVNGSVHIEKE